MRKILMMMIGLPACILSFASIAAGQALPVVTESTYQAGFELTYARPDFWVLPIGDPQYSRQYILGVTGYGSYNIAAHIGMEGEFHCICLITSLDRAELSYLVGPRIMFPHGRYDFYAKAMIGVRDLFIQESQDNHGIPSGMGGAYALGVGLDYNYSPRWNIRALEVEVQKWPSYSTNGINPVVISAGFAYRFP